MLDTLCYSSSLLRDTHDYKVSEKHVLVAGSFDSAAA
jgi:hypothetical protein